MEIIDKKHKEYVRGVIRGVPTISFSPEGKIYFSKKAVDVLGLNVFNKIHFASDLDRLYVYANSNDDGLEIRSNKTKTGMTVMSISIINILKKKHGSRIKLPCTFLLKPMLSKINESITAEIILNKKQ